MAKRRKRGTATAAPTSAKLSRGAPVGRFTTGTPSQTVPGRSTGNPRVKAVVHRFPDQKRDRNGRFM